MAAHPETTAAAESITFLEMTTQSAPAGERILVVDDEPEVLEVLREYLANRGHHVETAPNGEAALGSGS